MSLLEQDNYRMKSKVEKYRKPKGRKNLNPKMKMPEINYVIENSYMDLQDN